MGGDAARTGAYRPLPPTLVRFAAQALKGRGGEIAWSMSLIPTAWGVVARFVPRPQPAHVQSPMPLR